MDFLQLLKTVAPWIGAAIAGPLGGMAIKTAADVFGLTEKTIETLKQALTEATPEQMLALKKADQDFCLQMQTIGFKQIADLEVIAADDRKDARSLQNATRSIAPALLSGFITIGYFTVLVGLLRGWFTMNTDTQAMLLMLGSLTTGWGVVMAFWFGTTSDSGRKTELLAQSTPMK